MGNLMVLRKRVEPPLCRAERNIPHRSQMLLKRLTLQLKFAKNTGFALPQIFDSVRIRHVHNFIKSYLWPIAILSSSPSSMYFLRKMAAVWKSALTGGGADGPLGGPDCLFLRANGPDEVGVAVVAATAPATVVVVAVAPPAAVVEAVATVEAVAPCCCPPPPPPPLPGLLGQKEGFTRSGLGGL